MNTLQAQGSSSSQLMLIAVHCSRYRASLELSDGQTLIMPRAMLKERPYRGGTPFDRQSFDVFIRSRSYFFAMERAVSLLSVRARTEKELRSALLESAYPQEAIDRVLDYLCEAGYINDSDFASRWAASRVSKGMGSRRIQMELRHKGVNPDQIEHALESLDDDAQFEAALIAAKKAARGKNLALAPERQKVFAALARRGFDFSLARHAIERLRSELK